MKIKLLFAAFIIILTSSIAFSQDYYLGVGNGTEPQGTSCSSCHQVGNIAEPIYNSWKLTKHAQAYDSLKNILRYSCLKCHTTGWNDTVTNYGADEYVKADTSAPHGYVITDSVNFAKKANVQCEDCHGPLGTQDNQLSTNHWPFIQGSTNKPNYSAQLCGGCHSGHFPYFEQWSLSKHAQSTSGSCAITVGIKSCTRCHVAQNFIAYMKDPSAYKDTILVSGNDVQPLTCVACHDPHSAKNPGQLRLGISGTRVICDVCHYSSIKSVDITSIPHQTTGPCLSGDTLFGYRYPGKTYINSAHTYACTERCVNCHVNMTPNADGSNNTGHTFEPRVQACAGCHSDYYATVDTADPAKRFDYRGVQTTTDSLMNLLQTKLNDASSSDSSTAVFQEAQYNLLAVEGEGSRGIHNTRLVQKLLRDAIASFKTTGIKNETINTPQNFELSQNYPNPFNPVTTIKFTIAKAGNVKIIIYDEVGRQVKTLVNSYYSQGKYSVEWNATSFASGIYFYRLVTGNFNEVKKMILLK
jgi:predicted CXXCH cytochrome family protein